MPNNPMPFLVYKGAVDVANDHPEKTIEGLFGANGWGAMWRNGVYDYLHYHATVHEVLGVARGNAGCGSAATTARSSRSPRVTSRSCPPVPGINACRERGFFRRRRLSARPANARHAADAGKSCQGVEDNSGSEGAEDRSGARSGRAAGEVVEAFELAGRQLFGA